MKIKFGGEIYRIKVQYVSAEYSISGLRETWATLFKGDDEFLCSVISMCSIKDRFVKEKGRKLAIARLFVRWSDCFNKSPNKKQRTTFWRWYLNYPAYRCGNAVLDLDNV